MMPCCFVPGCKSNTNSKSARKRGEKISMFSPPRNEAIFEKWQRMLPRKDRPLRRCDRVCHLHFLPDHIHYDDVHIIQGETVRLPRIKAGLSKDAYPCIFPGLPKYLTKIPKYRKPPAKRSFPVKKTDKNNDETSKSNKDKTSGRQSDAGVYCGLNLDEAPTVDNNSSNFSFANVINNVDEIRLPLRQWASHVHENKNCVIFSHVTFTTNEFVVDKMVVLDESLQPKFSNNMSVASADFFSTVQSINNLESVLRSLENRRVCSGIVRVPMNEGQKGVTIKKVHEKCRIFISDQLEGDLCTQCKSEIHRLNRAQETGTIRKDLRNVARKRLQHENRRLNTKVSQLMKKLLDTNESDCNQLEITIV